MKRILTVLALSLVLLSFYSPVGRADPKNYTFGVLNQRSLSLTAEYWNPILEYVSTRSGVRLELAMGNNAPETSAMIGAGVFDFVYSNTIFTPANAPAGYRVFARPIEEAIQGQIVVLDRSPIRSLRDLDGKEVGFPSPAAFVGYAVPMNALLKAGVTVRPVFSISQEGIMGQLKAEQVIAAGVNSKVMRNYAQREGLDYRVLWTSEDYLNLPISVHPRVPEEVVRAVRDAFVGMADDPEGAKILKASAAVIKQPPPYGFVPADDTQYQNYREYYRTTLVKDLQ